MQFELANANLDPVALSGALQQLDPDARVALDSRRGRLEVLSSATVAQVLGALATIGCAATPLEQEVHISGGSTCCGHCS